MSPPTTSIRPKSRSVTPNMMKSSSTLGSRNGTRGPTWRWEGQRKCYPQKMRGCLSSPRLMGMEVWGDVIGEAYITKRVLHLKRHRLEADGYIGDVGPSLTLPLEGRPRQQIKAVDQSFRHKSEFNLNNRRPRPKHAPRGMSSTPTMSTSRKTSVLPTIRPP